MFICWLVLTGAKNGSLSNALKSTSKSGVSSCCGVVKNSLFVTLSGKGRVIVGSSRTSSLKCARSMTASSCSIKVRSKSVNRSREVCPESPLLLKLRCDCGQDDYFQAHCSFMIKLSHLRKVSSKKTSPSIMQCPHCL